MHVKLFKNVHFCFINLKDFFLNFTILQDCRLYFVICHMSHVTCLTVTILSSMVNMQHQRRRIDSAFLRQPMQVYMPTQQQDKPKEINHFQGDVM